MLRILVSYDIVSDRRRRHVSKVLARTLHRVQKSVFEGMITERDLIRLEPTLLARIDPTTDTVRIYRLCLRCHVATVLLGTSPEIPAQPEDVFD